MIQEYAIMAQIIAFMLGFLVQKIFSNIRESTFLSYLSDETLNNIHQDLRNHNRKQYDKEGN